MRTVASGVKRCAPCAAISVAFGSSQWAMAGMGLVQASYENLPVCNPSNPPAPPPAIPPAPYDKPHPSPRPAPSGIHLSASERWGHLPRAAAPHPAQCAPGARSAQPARPWRVSSGGLLGACMIHERGHHVVCLTIRPVSNMTHIMHNSLGAVPPAPVRPPRRARPCGAPAPPPRQTAAAGPPRTQPAGRPTMRVTWVTCGQARMAGCWPAWQPSASGSARAGPDAQGHVAAGRP